MDGSGGAKFKKSILPHVILRELHSDIELMLTNCRRSEKNVRSGSDKEDSDKLVDVESSDNVVNVGNVGDLVVNDADANLINFCATLEKAFR